MKSISTCYNHYLDFVFLEKLPENIIHGSLENYICNLWKAHIKQLKK